ncbi:PREDICTED: trihelix transcription factor GTL2 isoform X2 [Tarenaya hassleriana]|uniref:trihelix transcription factor GTL2 isoform X2 n=1 Tax=Tarenaya hassleriana TaxID=28532 RepID=UPI0008FD2AA4|nr:PREDICTED: trihelix transcription factor GTL2 isoform X2 [Tarenaya hassleriana]
MFHGGVPEQLRRFIAAPPQPRTPEMAAAAATRATPFPVSFSSFETTDHFMNSVLGNNNHKIIHHHDHHVDIKDAGNSRWMGPMNHDDDGHQYRHHHHHHPWSSDEVLALLRLRSTVENWFPGFTWEHISRKLMEVGFERTPQECKEKFEEEERRYFGNNNSNDHINHYNNNGKGNIRMFSELEEFYHHHGHDEHVHDDDHVSCEDGHGQNKRQKPVEEPRNQAKDRMGQDMEEGPREEEEEVGIHHGKSENIENDGKSSSSSSSAMAMMMMMMGEKKKKKKKKRKKEGFQLLKGFCEGLVRNMIAQQEELHRKVLEDMVKRDEEKVAREEAWKKQEMEMINKELEIRAHEQALASDRNSTIIKFISKFTSLSEDDNHHQQQHRHGNKVQSPSTSQSSSSLVLPETPNSKIQTLSSQTRISESRLSFHHNNEPISVQTLKTNTHNPKPPKSDGNCDLGKRWPRDEVLALVNIRCSISTKINCDHHDHEDQHHKDGPSSTSKAPPLWERISKKMLELGYERSAKRCKEKWENINKYFRKTKDVSKKRPVDSRTCPYFYQLSALYSQGSLAGATAGKEYSGGQDPETRVVSSNIESGDDPKMHVAANGDDYEKNTVQTSGFDFEF